MVEIAALNEILLAKIANSNCSQISIRVAKMFFTIVDRGGWDDDPIIGMVQLPPLISTNVKWLRIKQKRLTLNLCYHHKRRIHRLPCFVFCFRLFFGAGDREKKVFYSYKKKSLSIRGRSEFCGNCFEYKSMGKLHR